MARRLVALAILLVCSACSEDSSTARDTGPSADMSGVADAAPAGDADSGSGVDATVETSTDAGTEVTDSSVDVAPPCPDLSVPSAPTPSPPSSPTSLVPRIGTGGQAAGFPSIADESGLASAIPRPTNTCGVLGTVEERIADCQCKNHATAAVIDATSPEKHSWSLVVLGQDGSEVWRDNLTGYIWSDRIGWGSTDPTEKSFNWCQATGSNNQPGSPYAEEDPHGICTNPTYQSDTAPKSVCAEDLTYLSGITTSVPAKGGMGKLTGATTPLTWWIPSMYQARTAYTHGASKVFPRTFGSSGLWTGTMDSYDRKNAWQFTTYNEVEPRSASAPVVCIGAQ